VVCHPVVRESYPEWMIDNVFDDEWDHKKEFCLNGHRSSQFWATSQTLKGNHAPDVVPNQAKWGSGSEKGECLVISDSRQSLRSGLSIFRVLGKIWKEEFHRGSEIFNGLYRLPVNRLWIKVIDRSKGGYSWKLRHRFHTQSEHGK
jgi:hypothetical protein